MIIDPAKRRLTIFLETTVVKSDYELKKKGRYNWILSGKQIRPAIFEEILLLGAKQQRSLHTWEQSEQGDRSMLAFSC